MITVDHRATRETIWHFTCGSCGNWWSYATMETSWVPRSMHCPHCGHAAPAVICESVETKQQSVMLPFTDTFKLYVRPLPHAHKLSIRITDQSCDTYLTNAAQLDWLCSNWRCTDGASLEHSGKWFVQHKHVGTPREYVRISVWHSSICRDYRVSAADMERLSAQWQQEKIIITATEETQDAHS